MTTKDEIIKTLEQKSVCYDQSGFTTRYPLGTDRTTPLEWVGVQLRSDDGQYHLTFDLQGELRVATFYIANSKITYSRAMVFELDQKLCRVWDQRFYEEATGIKSLEEVERSSKILPSKAFGDLETMLDRPVLRKKP